MYAVIESGGKQYRVDLGSEIQVDRLDVRSGDAITLERVLLVADDEATVVGRPVVDGATVTAQVLGQDRGPKGVVFKYKQKTRHRVKKGFRAELTTLRISDIAFDGRSAAEAARASASQEAEAARDAEKVAAAKAAADKALAARLAAASEPPDAETAPTPKATAASAKPAASQDAEKAPPADEAARAADESAPEVDVTAKGPQTLDVAAPDSVPDGAPADNDGAAVDPDTQKDA